MIDATKMPDLDVAEMVADWCAVSEERGNHPKTWADKNVNVRLKFTDDQKKILGQVYENWLKHFFPKNDEGPENQSGEQVQLTI